VVSAKRETLEKLLWRRIKIAKGYDGTREIVRIMSREVSSRARRCAFFFRRTQKFVQLSRLEFFFSLSFSLSSLVFFRSRLFVVDDGDDDVTRDDG